MALATTTLTIDGHQHTAYVFAITSSGSHVYGTFRLNGTGAHIPGRLYLDGVGTSIQSNLALIAPANVPPVGNAPEPATCIAIGAGLSALGMLKRSRSGPSR